MPEYSVEELIEKVLTKHIPPDILREIDQEKLVTDIKDLFFDQDKPTGWTVCTPNYVRTSIEGFGWAYWFIDPKTGEMRDDAVLVPNLNV